MVTDVDDFLKQNLAKRVIVQTAVPGARGVADARRFHLEEFFDVPFMILPWGAFTIIHSGLAKTFPFSRLYLVEFDEKSEAVRRILENTVIATEDQMRTIQAMKRAHQVEKRGVG